uniref:Uncharacterized protein n=1 Tax=Theileria parva TaxID=5875 RepID=Q4N4B3_THEPA|eukprot:XP_765293.1 hypothetical protein [Theileria parva strain Muguga]
MVGSITSKPDRKRLFDPEDTWLVVGLLLSFPSSYLTYIINNAYGTKSGLLAEVVLLIVSFFWMAVGTIEVSMSTTCQNTNPGVWWVSFVSINIFWYWKFRIMFIQGIMFFQGGRNPEFNIE